MNTSLRMPTERRALALNQVGYSRQVLQAQKTNVCWVLLHFLKLISPLLTDVNWAPKSKRPNAPLRSRSAAVPRKLREALKISAAAAGEVLPRTWG